ncbi:MAG TPA: tetratricopeptide repeat protein, partial [Kofleriaceae bacterium]|nr:tetratricopeptide repeat protein [Kofleriaceae bacterium]
MDAARKFVDKGQIDKAVKEYLRIVHEDPKDVRVWLKIGDLYAKKGAKQDAIETYLKVARFYHDQGFLHKSVAVYKQIVKLDPRLVDVILKLAELYRELRMMPEAMQHFESVAAHFHREGNTKEALATVKKLVDLDPENIATRIKLAELYSKEGLVDEAAIEFQLACEQLRRQGRQDDFLKVAERLLWHKPANQPLNRELAALYLRRNDPRRALQKLQACFKADPRDVETLGLLAQAFQALEQKAKTVSVLKELARIHVENKHKELAAEVFRKILELLPTDPDAIAFLGPAAARPSQQLSPPPRPVTQMPPQIRAATSDARFNLTSDLPSYEPASARMTGSMPLIDEQSLSGVDFALPEYDDSDFSADMEPPPDPRLMSADGERHAEEIQKILAETDVYVKYGLHQQAVDHLRRVFALDVDNVEARERLKDIFLSQGREQEAEAELLRLAELVAPGDPDRAEAYLQELLSLAGTHTGAYDLARKFRLRVARLSSVSSEVEVSSDYGGIALIDGEASASRDSVDEFDPAELIGRSIAHGSPAPARPPRRPNGGYASDADNFELDFEPSPSQATRQMSPEIAEALAQRGDELDGPMIVDRPHWGGSLDEARALDRQLDDIELGDDIDRHVARELARGGGKPEPEPLVDDDLPFDPDEARAFDAAVTRASSQLASQSMGEVIGQVSGETDAIYVAGFEETRREAGPGDSSSYDAVHDDGLHDALQVSGGYDPYGTEAAQTPASFADPTASHAVSSAYPADQAAHGGRPETSVEDDLDEAEFYSSQAMYAEAIDVLNALLARYPGHRMVLAKLREVETLAAGGEVADPALLDASSDVHGQAAPGGTDALDLDEIEEVAPEELVELDANSQPIEVPRKRQPTVMLEKPVDEGDAATHYDLGLAYKEMALHDDAIKAFEKALRAPGREVGCRVMIGMCLREMGNPSEAVHQFKQGLHAEPTERERQSLYYEIGMTYEAIGDPSEALYFFEMVLKRDPTFADAAARAERLRAGGGHAMHANDDDI